MKNKLWSREEFLLVMNLYTKIPYGQFHSKNPDVIELAKILKRTPGAVAYKLVHFAGLDPFHKKRGIKGLSNPGKNAINIYKDFMANWEEMIIESETLLIHYKNNEKTETTENILDNDVFSSFSQKEGKDKKRFTNTRLNQALFRKIILGNYFNTCSICGLDVASLLIASHILKWSEYKKERINPTNGICLCSIHDRAFEIGYLGITPEYKIHISKNLNSISDQNTSNALFFRHQNQDIQLPDKFHPNPDFLKLHYNSCFQS